MSEYDYVRRIQDFYWPFNCSPTIQWTWLFLEGTCGSDVVFFLFLYSGTTCAYCLWISILGRVAVGPVAYYLPVSRLLVARLSTLFWWQGQENTPRQDERRSVRAQWKEPTAYLTYEAAHVPISVSIGDTLERLWPKTVDKQIYGRVGKAGGKYQGGSDARVFAGRQLF